MTAQFEPPEIHPPDLLIGVVGVCASGKSTLVSWLTNRGYRCRHIAQEHSYVPDMWQRLTNPDILVFLEVTYEVTLKRKNLNWTQEEYNEQLHRTRHALAHADICIQTDNLTADELGNLVEMEIDRFISNHQG